MRAKERVRGGLYQPATLDEEGGCRGGGAQPPLFPAPPPLVNSIDTFAATVEFK